MVPVLLRHKYQCNVTSNYSTYSMGFRRKCSRLQLYFLYWRLLWLLQAYVINLLDVVTQVLFCLKTRCIILALTVNQTKDYLFINASCINNSFANVSWRPKRNVKINQVTVEYACHNTSTSSLVSLYINNS